MLDDYYEIEESEIPKSLNSAKVIDWATELGKDFEYYQKARHRLDTEIIPECDKAFMAIKPEYTIGAIKQVDNSALGDATLRTVVKGYRNQVIGQFNSPGESWLACSSMEDEDDDEDLLDKIKEMNIRLNYEAKTMDTLAIATDQLLVRGMTAVGVMWEKRRVIRSIPEPLAETIGDVAESMQEMGQPLDAGEFSQEAPEEGAEPIPLTKESAKKIKVWKDFFAQPVVYPIDIYRLYWDPRIEMSQGTDMPYVYVAFKTMADLKHAKDPNTGKPLYDQKALKEAREMTYQDYYADFPQACEATKLMGIDPDIEEAGKFVPVYLFYKLEREFEDGSYFVDKFFYVIRTNSDSGWRIIRIQDNPSEYGDKPFYFTTCDQWLNAPVGVGIVEKSLPPWKHKNLIADMGLLQKCLSVLPPMWYFQGVIKDDKQPKLTVGGMQAIMFRPGIGKDWIGHYPVNPGGALLSDQEEQALGQKIIDQTGITTVGIKGSPQNRTGKKERTATEVRQEATEGIIGLAYIVEKLSQNIVQPVAQTIYNGARQNFQEGYKFVTRIPTGEIKTVHLDAMDIDKDRRIEVVGKRAMDSKAHIMENLNKVLEILLNKNAAAILGPSFALIANDVLIKIIMRLGLEMKPEYKQTPQEIMAGNPQAQLEMLQAALQTPEGMQIAADFLLNSPEGQQFIQQVMAQGQSMAKEQPQGGPQQ